MPEVPTLKLGALGSAATGYRHQGDGQPGLYTQSKLWMAHLPTVLRD